MILSPKFKYPIFLISFILGSISCSLINLTAQTSPEKRSSAPETPSLFETTPEKEVHTERSPIGESSLDNDLNGSPQTNSGECTNPLYPIDPGFEWNYEIKSPNGNNQIKLSVSEIFDKKAIMDVKNMNTREVTKAQAECDQGAIINYPLLLLIFLDAGGEGAIKLDHVDGVYAPNAKTFSEHDWILNWETEYLANGVIQATVGGSVYTGRLDDSPLMMDWKTLGDSDRRTESVQVKAGYFPNAIKVNREITLDFDAEIEDENDSETISVKMDLTTSLWFEPNIGLLKQIVEKAGVRVFGLRFPFDLEGSIELITFQSEE